MASEGGQTLIDGESCRYPVKPWRAWLTLVLLGLLFLVSFVDRFILALLVEPLKDDLGISEVQLGLLFGTAFALFYAFLGLPFARFADRFDRRKLIVAGALLWSLSTIASGLVNSYGLLVFLRIGLAIGEAALTPSAFSMIGDLFPAHRRRRAASIYQAFGMFGAGGGYLIGGLIVAILAEKVGQGGLGDFRLWQLVFISVGVPSLLLTILFAAFVREPRRLVDAGRDAGSRLGDLFRYYRSKAGVFTSLIVGTGLCQVPVYAMIAWMPYTLQQVFGLQTAQTGYLFGVTAILATVGGTLILPWLSDRFEHRLASAAAPVVSGISAIVAIVAIGSASQAASLAGFIMLSGLGLMLLSGAGNNILVAFQQLAPANMRATFAALCLLSITLLGLGIGPPLFAVFKASLGEAGQSGFAMPLLALVAGLPAALLMANAVRLLRRD